MRALGDVIRSDIAESSDLSIVLYDHHRQLYGGTQDVAL